VEESRKMKDEPVNGTSFGEAGNSTEESSEAEVDEDTPGEEDPANEEGLTEIVEPRLSLTELAQQPNITLDLIYQQCDEGCALNS